MVTIQSKAFLKSDGTDPINCRSNPTDSIYIELVVSSDGYPTTWENMITFEARIINSSNVCFKKFEYNNRCLKANVLYTWRSSIFSLSVADTYYIALGGQSNFSCPGGQLYATDGQVLSVVNC